MSLVQSWNNHHFQTLLKKSKSTVSNPNWYYDLGSHKLSSLLEGHNQPLAKLLGHFVELHIHSYT